MVEISSESLLLVLVMVMFGVSTIFIITHYKNKIRLTGENEPVKGVKRRAERGQEDAVETLKDLTAESIKFLKDTTNDLRTDNKRLKSSLAYYKAQLYGSGEITQDDMNGKPTTTVRQSRETNVGDDIVQMRLKMIAEKINIPPLLLAFPDVENALTEIASSPDFDRIAATALSTNNQAAKPNVNAQDINYV